MAPIQGPPLYTQLVVDSPPDPVAGGGQLIYAVSFGLKLFDMVLGSLCDSGLYFVRAIPVAESGDPDAPINQLSLGAQTATYRLVWYIEASGAEVEAGRDLTGEVVRLLAIGPK